MFDNIYLEKIAKNVGLKGELLPNKAEAMDRALLRDMEGEVNRSMSSGRHVTNYGAGSTTNRRITPSFEAGDSSYRNTFYPEQNNTARRKGLPVGKSYIPEGTPDPRESLYHRRYGMGQESKPLLLEYKPAAPVAAPAAAPVAAPAKPVSAAAKKGMGLAAKLGLGGLAAAGLAGGAYYAMNDSSHSKRASAIEGLVLAGYSVEQALQILEG